VKFDKMKKTQYVSWKKDHAMSCENKQEKDNMQESMMDSLTTEASVAQYNESMKLATQFRTKLNVSSKSRSNNEVRTKLCDKDVASSKTKVCTVVTFDSTVITLYSMIHLTNLASILRIPLDFKFLFICSIYFIHYSYSCINIL